ncbi:hypothetical protein MF672_004505 [Actinomadura sp. ATCC 31491]|uniref:Uncharacterized protein n=1 Tax=Actinomadura luzonensis TaxID=2805427 RepID=A0ABT0FM81_9ACTN|nr:hypothetical protein [Actinomadura luzonensis]MCK2213061.1 hypothetical protein [Actinomadura luzonensis]
MPHVLAAIGPEALAELLTEIALEHWPAAAVGDVLPALHVLDPEEADEPPVAIALDRAGSWTGLLALTGRELADQPFIKARPVLSTLFGAVFTRLSHRQDAGGAVVAPAAPAVPAPRSEAAPVVADEPLPLPAPAAPADPEPVQAQAEEQAEEDERPEEPAEPSTPEEPEPVDAAPAQAFEAEPVEDLQEHEQEHEQEQERGEESASEDEPAGERPVLDADAEPAADAGDGPEPTPDSVEEPAPEPAAEEAEALEAHHLESGAPTEDDEHEDDEHEDDEHEDDEHEDEHPEDEHADGAHHQELPDLIEAAFSGLDDKSWAVAQNRVFTDEPSAVDQLAKLFAVPPAEITATEEEFRVRLGEWLASDEAAPYRAHLEELREKLGPEAPKEQVIGAADWHSVEIRALEVPAWQFVLATLPGRPEAPRADPAPQVEAAPKVEVAPPPRLDPVLHFEPPRQPPMDMPPQSAFGPVPLPPSPPPGPPQFQAFRPGGPHEQNGAPGDKPYQPLKDVSQTRRCFRQPDGRWWLRVDVTAEQMAGGECALPTGFAAYLGLSPGESRTVRSAAGELTMTWHGRPVLESIERLLVDVGAREGGHLFLTLSDEGVLRARHLPVAAQGAEKITKALRLVGYTAPGGTRDQAARVIATRIGMTGPVSLPDLLTRLRERGDRDLLALLD